jgi:hypothetical protein
VACVAEIASNIHCQRACHHLRSSQAAFHNVHDCRSCCCVCTCMYVHLGKRKRAPLVVRAFPLLVWFDLCACLLAHVTWVQHKLRTGLDCQTTAHAVAALSACARRRACASICSSGPNLYMQPPGRAPYQNKSSEYLPLALRLPHGRCDTLRSGDVCAADLAHRWRRMACYPLEKTTCGQHMQQAKHRVVRQTSRGRGAFATHAKCDCLTGLVVPT